MKKIYFILIFLLLIIISLWIWYYGPNYLLPLPNRPRIAKNAIQIPVNKIFIVKENNKYASIKVLRLNWNKGAFYECWYQGDGSGDFSSNSVIYQQGKVYENYLRTPISPTKTLLENNKGKSNIECGPFIIEWSNQNWIYFKGYGVEGSSYLVSPTNISNISQINVFDRNLEWFSQESH